MTKVLGLSRWKEDNLTPETDPAKIATAIEDFRNIALEILLGKTENFVLSSAFIKALSGSSALMSWKNTQ